MRTEPAHCPRTLRQHWHDALLIVAAALLYACASPQAAAPTGANAAPSAQGPSSLSAPNGGAPVPAAPTAPPLVAKPFKEAVAEATAQLLATLPHDMPARAVVVDPLLDGVTAEQNRATKGMETIVQQYVRDNQKKYWFEPLSVKSLDHKPLLLIGTFTGINDQGQTSGARVVYRICLALADTATNTIVAKGVARATSEGVDLTPLNYFRDAPAWSADKVTDGYIRSCQGTKPGDAMDSFYRARLIAGASVNHAVEAYNAERYQSALDFYSIAMRAGSGDELRILNGVYLANWKLKRKQAAKLVVQRVVDFGIERKRMAIKFLFQPGSISFWKDPDFLTAYPMWMDELARQAAKRNACLNVLGHTSRGDPDKGDVALSQDRAQFVRHLLVDRVPALERNINAIGRGAQDNLIGNGHNDTTDVLDRRVVFQVIDCQPGKSS